MTRPTSSPRRRAALAAGLAALIFTAAACGDDSTPQSSDATAEEPSGGGLAVSISTFMFDPDPLQVKVGDEVTWTNDDAILHTVTSGDREYDPENSGLVTATNKDGLFDLQLDGKGSSDSFTFTEAGTYHYFCDRHPGMEADIEVS